MCYLTPTSPEAFVDFTKHELPVKHHPDWTVECPQCKGYGGWNLRLNAYPLRDMPDTAENRHRYSHFRAACSHCYGWGYVAPADADHVHDWQHVRNLGNCLNLYKCSVCNKLREVDSSD